MGARHGKESMCLADCHDTDISKVGVLRLIGSLCICFSVIEAGLGGAIYTFLLHPNLLSGFGSWWAGILIFIAGACACFANNRSAVIAASVFSTSGVYLAALGLIADGMRSGTVSQYSKCGSIAVATDQSISFTGYSHANNTALCLTSQGFILNTTPLNNGACYCFDSTGLCTRFDLRLLSQTCDGITTVYSKELIASTVLCAILVLFGCLLSSLTFTILCQNTDKNSPEAMGHKKWLVAPLAPNPLVSKADVTSVIAIGVHVNDDNFGVIECASGRSHL